jgi:RNA polymerase sigma-70 factor (ECF subfamily)
MSVFFNNANSRRQFHHGPVNHLRLVPPRPSGDTADEACLAAFQGELDYIYRTLSRLGAGPFDVDDLVQDLFIILRRSWKEYDPTRPLRPYLFGIAFRITSAHRRKRRREVPCGAVEIDDSAPGPDDTLRAKRSQALLQAALERIPLRRRAILIMHELDGIAVSDVAKVFKIPLFTAYSRLRKARRELQVAVRRLVRGTKTNAPIA